ncbi:hypothetical protein AVEN_151269-1 [Araneus ventricosus]|uniref:DDE-1 domain-containing protein n=1 Tax=Araneus ventricosus TaxID=182803 RepID=A0A4Y2HK17_ARAVE|nr:hypothetical protein AVEN_151269-1 [Araneus ventricosus]
MLRTYQKKTNRKSWSQEVLSDYTIINEHYLILIDDAPPGSFAQYHPSGWMLTESFVYWFQKFMQFFKPSTGKPVLLILDGHATHTKSLDLMNLDRGNNFTVSPNCFHRMQPLNVTFMAPLSTF